MKELLVVGLLVVSIYMGFAPYHVHCSVFSKISSKKCPPHMCLLILSGLIYGMTICIVQEEYLRSLYNYMSGAAHTGGRIVLAGSNLVKNAAGNFNNLSEFADTVESIAEAST